MGYSVWRGLSADELALLRMSVGYGRHQRGRPLYPVECGRLFRRAERAGASRAESAREVRLDASGVGRFLRLLELPPEVQDWVDWGRGNFVGFSSASELVRLRDHEEQRLLADAILSDRLTSKEVRQVVQLRERSNRAVEECVAEIVGMRPVVEKRYVFMGAVVDGDIVAALGDLAQSKRDEILAGGIEAIGLCGASGRLGTQIFTLVGGEDFGESMARVGRGAIEGLVRDHLQESIESGASRS